VGGTGVGYCSVCTAESSATATAGGVAVVFLIFCVVPFAPCGAASFAFGIPGSLGTGHCGQHIHELVGCKICPRWSLSDVLESPRLPNCFLTLEFFLPRSFVL